MIRFREIELNDIEMIREWRNSEEVKRFMYNQKNITSEQQLKWYHSIKNDISSIYQIIEYKEIAIGLSYITDISTNSSSCYWGFYIGAISFSGIGLGSVVEYEIIQYIFNELKLNKLRCDVMLENVRVINLHEKFGFRREAYYREHVILDGQKKDVIGLALLKNEWKAIQPYIHKQIFKN